MDYVNQFMQWLQNGHGAGFPLWLQILMAIVMLAFAIFGSPWLLRMAELAKTRTESIKIDNTTSLISQRGAIMKQVENYLEWKVMALAASNFPILCKDIQSGMFSTVDSAGKAHIDAAKIKAALQAWGKLAKEDVISHFSVQGGFNIVTLYGECGLDDLIDAIATKYAPFPGIQTSAELAKKEVVPLLIENGLEWVRKYYGGSLPLSELVHAGVANPDGTPTASAPPATTPIIQ